MDPRRRPNGHAKGAAKAGDRELHGRASAAELVEVAAALAELPERLGDVPSAPAAAIAGELVTRCGSSPSAATVPPVK